MDNICMQWIHTSWINRWCACFGIFSEINAVVVKFMNLKCIWRKTCKLIWTSAGSSHGLFNMHWIPTVQIKLQNVAKWLKIWILRCTISSYNVVISQTDWTSAGSSHVRYIHALHPHCPVHMCFSNPVWRSSI